MNGYELSRAFVDFCFENPSKIKPNHYAMFFFAIEHCNRLGWKKEFGLPTTMTMEAIGVKSYKTYINTFNDLIEFGFFKIVQRSKNQHSSNIIEIVKFDKANTKALDKAMIKHCSKQVQSTVSINKPINKEPINKEQRTRDFNIFWDAYDKKIDAKKCKDKFTKLPQKDIDSILSVVHKYVKSTPDKTYRKNPLTWLNGKCWNDEIETPKKSGMKMVNGLMQNSRGIYNVI